MQITISCAHRLIPASKSFTVIIKEHISEHNIIRLLMFVSMFNSVTAPVVESFKWNECSEDLHKCSNFPLAFYKSFANAVGMGGSWCHEDLNRRGTQGPLLSKPPEVFPYRNQKRRRVPHESKQPLPLSPHIKWSGPKFNTHLGHSYERYLRISAASIPGRIERH